MRKTHICVSVYGGGERELGQRVSTALARGADLVEVRLDMSNVKDWNRLYSILKPFSDRLVFTLRPVDEGGRSTLPDSVRLDLLERMGSMGPAYMDVELRTANNNNIERLRKQGSRLIVSWHSESTPAVEELLRKAEDCLRYGDIAKIVTLSNDVYDNFKTLMLYTYLPAERLIAFCMGEKGWITRILSMAAGAPIAYASLEELTTAPGQLSLKNMIEIRERILTGLTAC